MVILAPCVCVCLWSGVVCVCGTRWRGGGGGGGGGVCVCCARKIFALIVIGCFAVCSSLEKQHIEEYLIITLLLPTPHPHPPSLQNSNKSTKQPTN